MIAKTKLTDVDMTKLIENKVAFTNEQIGNMYDLQLQTVLEHFLSEVRDNTKVNKDFRTMVSEAITQGDTDTMRRLIIENQEQFLINEDLSNGLIASEDISKDTVLENSDDSGKIKAETEVGIYFEDEQWRGKTQLDYQPSSGVKLVATPGKTTTIIGNFNRDMKAILAELGIDKSKNFGAKISGFNVLNVPDIEYELYASVFWEKFNVIWLNKAIERGDIILLATEPTYYKLYRKNPHTGKMELTGFGKEYMHLKNNGYKYDIASKQMIKWR